MRLGAFFPILGDGQRLDLAMKNGDFMGIYYDFMVKNGGIPWGFYDDFMGSWELMGYITNYWMKLDCMPSSRGTECRNHFCSGIYVPMVFGFPWHGITINQIPCNLTLARRNVPGRVNHSSKSEGVFVWRYCWHWIPKKGDTDAALILVGWLAQQRSPCERFQSGCAQNQEIQKVVSVKFDSFRSFSHFLPILWMVFFWFNPFFLSLTDTAKTGKTPVLVGEIWPFFFSGHRGVGRHGCVDLHGSLQHQEAELGGAIRSDFQSFFYG